MHDPTNDLYRDIEKAPEGSYPVPKRLKPSAGSLLGDSDKVRVSRKTKEGRILLDWMRHERKMKVKKRRNIANKSKKKNR